MANICLPVGLKANKQTSLVSIFVDIQNVHLTKRQANLLLDFANYEGRLGSVHFYYNSHRKDQVEAKNNLENFGKWVDVPVSLKNSADNQLIADCIKRVFTHPSLSLIILVLGDWDFAGLISILKATGKKVIIFAQRGSASPRLIRLVGDENFYFVDTLPNLVQNRSENQTNTVLPFINYADATDLLLEALKLAIIKSKSTKLSTIDLLMRQCSSKYKGVGSIRKLDGSNFSCFSKFIDAVVKDGRVRKENEELLLVQTSMIAV